MNKYCFFIACLLITLNINAQNDSFDLMLDSIQRLRKLYKNEAIDLDTRLKYAKTASKLSHKTKIDSTILLSNLRIAFIHLLKKNYSFSIKLNHKNLRLAHKINDSLNKAHINSQLAYCYSLLGKQKDSAFYYYYKSFSFYKKLNKTKNAVWELNNIASLQNDERNYTGSEVTVIKAINLLKSLPNNNENYYHLFSLYNEIGLSSKHLKLYDKAIEYHQKSLIINDKISDEHENVNDLNKSENYLYAKINIAEAYKEKGDYKKALSIYKELLKDKGLLKKDPLSYAAVINNKAYNLFLSKGKNTKYIYSLFNKAYKISDSLNALYEIASVGNDMAEFYYAINKKDSALILSKRSYKIGKNIKNYQEVSRSLLTLSKIEEGQAGKQYLYEHIKLNDSLLDVERASRNKFARIQYETDTYIDETKRLGTQNILIVVIGLILFLILALIFIIRAQIAKNKILRFESEQQKANEEIYTLMLRQQAKVEEGRLLERHRISEELHDGILNKLLGSRLGLEFLSMDEDTESKEKYSFYIHEIQSIEREIRDLSHELKNTQLDADKDFMTIVKDYIGNQSSLHPFQYKINQKGTIFWEAITDYIKVNLYRVIQEAIQNVIKHAKATTLTVDFSLNSNELHLDIRDNGIGFNSNQKHEGIGLLNIASRVSKLKGTFNMKSEIKKGTILAIKIPLS
ncbi:tetratricopeptide repeat-containing sensor histidine kinase [Flavivirga spongiicola]|uniref:histidine kinase n=1 Tax=Flavivirga spongiicola TaxID=421621 RepID=A0ABU7XZE8_9FLAO|nr:tetratricopeptide repeat-containing sensor histidine kinase [Flavivirga sp. MEBiC05379]MDO5981161.1 ATP-binding protein [Flavivirga sp. MEBiC05379]